MAPPTSRKEVRKFIGVINYYRDIWSRRLHKLALLTKLTFMKRNFKWSKFEQDDFNKIKRIADRDTLFAYTDFNEKFKIHTDASAFQLWAVIIHKGEPIALYSRKLTDAQQRYIATERELLSIVENLMNFRTLLLAQKLRIYTDNKNLTCKILNTDRVSIWRLILKEYGPDIEYIKVEKNMFADGL